MYTLKPRTRSKQLILTNHIVKKPKPKAGVDTSVCVYDTLKKNKYFKKLPKNSELRQLLEKSANGLTFFRYTADHSMFNYWQPASNAGIPAVPRSSLYHETKFFIHDILHQLVPDLQISRDDVANKRAYIIHRMVGEAITMVYADMLFPEFMEKTKAVEPDEFWKHKIYPAYKELNNTVKSDIFYNMAMFAITGKKFTLDTEAGNKFERWAAGVFCSDLEWTEANYNAITNRDDNHISSYAYYHWVERYFKPVYKVLGFNDPYTTEEVVEKVVGYNSSDDEFFSKYLPVIVRYAVHDYLTRMKSYRNAPATKHEKDMLFWSFQGIITGNELSGKVMEEYYTAFKDASNGNIGFDKCAEILASALQEDGHYNVCSEYRDECVPMFPAKFFSYSKAMKDGKNPSQVFNTILSGYKNTKKQMHANLINASGGVVFKDNVFRPGVALISKTVETANVDNIANVLMYDGDLKLAGISAKLNMMHNELCGTEYIDRIISTYNHRSILNGYYFTFMISGVTASTMIEFLASGLVDNRLTTDDTSAQDNTLYVYNHTMLPPVEAFKRVHYTANHDQYLANVPREIKNKFNIGFKAMSFTVTVNLKDFPNYVERKLNGNYETEFKEILKRMYSIVNNR